MEPRAYYYGDGMDHIVYLTEEQADALNKCRILTHVDDPITGEWLVTTNLSQDEMAIYNVGAAILNEYLETHDNVTWEDTSQPSLRPVE